MKLDPKARPLSKAQLDSYVEAADTKGFEGNYNDLLKVLLGRLRKQIKARAIEQKAAADAKAQEIDLLK